MKRLWFRFVLPMLLALPAFGWEFDYTVTIDSHNPRYELPTVDLTGLQGGGHNNVRYDVTNFVAPYTGLFVFLSVASWDNFLVLYRTAFDPSQPLVNAVVANDNNPTVGRAGFTAMLKGGEQYFVVTSPASNGGGSFTAANQVAPVPEPSTWVTMAGALAVSWRIHLNNRRRT